MEDIFVKRREVFFNNLVLLGLDDMSFEKDHGIQFHKDMFVLPNKKGFEIVTHFLFSKLTAATGEDYNIPWPLLGKEYDRMFQKTCYAHLVNFSQENDVNFPQIVPSLLSTFGGNRFYEVYLAFSHYVLCKTIKKNNNINLQSRPVVTSENFAATKSVLELSTSLILQKFNETLKFTYNCHLMWEALSNKLTEYLQALKQSRKIYEEKIIKKEVVVSSLYSSIPRENLNWKLAAEKSFEYWKPMLKRRKFLEHFFLAEKKYWNILATEIGEKAENEFLNGQDYDICINHNLPKEYQNKLEIVDFSTAHKDGKLSILRFIKLLMAYLIYIAELLKTTDFKKINGINFDEALASVKKDLGSLNEFNKNISEKVVLEMEENIKRIKLRTCFDNLDKSIELSYDQFCTPISNLFLNLETVEERNTDFTSSLKEMSLSKVISSKEDFIDDVFISEKFPTSHSSCMQLSNLPAEKKINNDAVEKDMTYTSGSQDTFFSASNSETYNVPPSVFTFDDIPSPHTDFKMRESWLNEECLTTMTLPEVSFDD